MCRQPTTLAWQAAHSRVPAQWMFLGFYLVLTALVLAIYQRAGRRVFPPWVVVLLMLSKRVHSIFMLRLFNDGVSILLMHVAVLLLTYRKVCGVATWSRSGWCVGC